MNAEKPSYTKEECIQDIQEENAWLQEQQEKAEAAGDADTAKKAAGYILKNENLLKALNGEPAPDSSPTPNPEGAMQITNATSSENEPLAKDEDEYTVLADGTIFKNKADALQAKAGVDEKFER